MINQDEKKRKKEKEKEVKNPLLKPDPGTLGTTDPQEHMKGPLSSTIQNIKEEGEKNDGVSKEEAEKEREKNM